MREQVLAGFDKSIQYLPQDPGPFATRIESKRYWRGPAWIVVNDLVADGLKRCGLDEVAAEVNADSLALFAKSGFGEYYDSLTGEGLGGSFTWTAAMVAELVARHRGA